MLDTRPLLLDTDFPPLRRGALTTLQVNLGYLCNLSCTHCHVNAGPKRTELMSRENVELVLQVLKHHRLQTLDLTGGAPEMNPHFRYLVEQATELGVEVIDRCNLTILQEPGYEDLAEFLADHKVTIVASLPCYSEQNVNKQRGKGVFGDSIDALQKLNKLGYGIRDDLPLNLVYNPNGAFLPPPQMQLENDYKQQLREQFGIEFHSLFTITNMPISRFGGMLLAKGLFNDYMDLLKQSYSDNNLETVMCHSLISVDWQGNLYDCDFNQMLELPLQEVSSLIASDRQRHLSQLLQSDFNGNPIVIGEHCYGCTAGQGSSCGGALEE
ncbi:arsenosugar biosynthesis radical SAM protein ArsS [bacterium SCSIO 12696]|nr:arsenosugar biosynthesis radical SAM protein ArsS [bacterium SCSIO 12696]